MCSGNRTFLEEDSLRVSRWIVDFAQWVPFNLYKCQPFSHPSLPSRADLNYQGMSFVDTLFPNFPLLLSACKQYNLGGDVCKHTVNMCHCVYTLFSCNWDSYTIFLYQLGLTAFALKHTASMRLLRNVYSALCILSLTAVIFCMYHSLQQGDWCIKLECGLQLILKVLVATIDALGHFETG